MRLYGRLTQYQQEEIEKIFWDRDYAKKSHVIRDLMKIGFDHIKEFDNTEINSSIDERTTYIPIPPTMEERIKTIRKEERIKDKIVIVRTLIEIGLKHRDELPNSSA